MNDKPEYPKRMTHPNYWPGSVGTEQTGPGGFKYHTGGLPARFPPVIVGSADDEAYYAAKGYIARETSDIHAFMASVAVTDVNYQPIEYPKWVNDVLVNNAEEEGRVLAGKPTEPEPPEDEVTRLRREVAELQAMLDAATAPTEDGQDAPLTRGQKAWATRQANAAKVAGEATEGQQAA